jgi:hypothetical protein
MSDADAKRLREERLRMKQEAHAKARQKTLRMDPIVPKINNKNLELTIRLQSSTIDKLKEVSWILDKSGNDRTYDELIIFLIHSY